MAYAGEMGLSRVRVSLGSYRAFHFHLNNSGTPLESFKSKGI